MHKAPSVSYPVGPCAWYGRVLWLALALVVLAGVAAAALGQHPNAWSAGLAMALCLGVAFAVASHLSSVPSGRLAWHFDDADSTPGEWVWVPDRGRAAWVTVAVAWSGSSALGLRLVDGRGKTHWVWAQAHQTPQDWLPLRRALISSVSPE
jgi:hypothetical protein